MPHIKDPIFGKEAKDTAKQWNFALTPEKLEKLFRMDIIASSFTDPGPEYCRFLCYAESGEHLGTFEVPGH